MSTEETKSQGVMVELGLFKDALSAACFLAPGYGTVTVTKQNAYGVAWLQYQHTILAEIIFYKIYKNVLCYDEYVHMK
jgi:hypothetical protein